MAIQSNQNFAAASTFYSTMFNQFFQGSPDLGNLYKSYCFVDSKIGTNYQVPFMDALTMGREWKGKKVFVPGRANKLNIATTPYEASTSVDMVSFDQDPNYAGQAIRTWLSGQINFINEKVVTNVVKKVDTLIGYDGVAFASAAHPRINGLANQSNTTSSSLSEITYIAARAAMRSFTDGAGRPLGVQPKILLVGPALEDVARRILETKLITRTVNNAGAIGQTSNVVAAAAADNTLSNDGVQVVVEPLLADGTHDYWWFLLGTNTAATLAPFVVNLAKAPYPTDNVEVFKEASAEYRFSIEAQLSIGLGIWQHAYCGLASS